MALPALCPATSPSRWAQVEYTAQEKTLQCHPPESRKQSPTLRSQQRPRRLPASPERTSSKLQADRAGAREMAEVPAYCTASRAIPRLLMTVFPAPISYKSYQRDLITLTVQAIEQGGAVCGWCCPRDHQGRGESPVPFQPSPLFSVGGGTEPLWRQPGMAPRTPSTAFL